jgi:hypothetical protein
LLEDLHLLQVDVKPLWLRILGTSLEEVLEWAFGVEIQARSLPPENIQLE